MIEAVQNRFRQGQFARCAKGMIAYVPEGHAETIQSEDATDVHLR
jgi:hypothetical protein